MRDCMRLEMVPRRGLEPPRPQRPPAPEAGVSTNFTIWALCARTLVLLPLNSACRDSTRRVVAYGFLPNATLVLPAHRLPISRQLLLHCSNSCIHAVDHLGVCNSRARTIVRPRELVNLPDLLLLPLHAPLLSP